MKILFFFQLLPLLLLSVFAVVVTAQKVDEDKDEILQTSEAAVVGHPLYARIGFHRGYHRGYLGHHGYHHGHHGLGYGLHKLKHHYYNYPRLHHGFVPSYGPYGFPLHGYGYYGHYRYPKFHHGYYKHGYYG